MSYSNKISVDRLSITITCDRNDIATQTKITEYYPVHANRIGTRFVVSPRYLMKVLKDFRGIDESNIDTAPQTIQKLYYDELIRQRHMSDLLSNGPSESARVNDHLQLKPHQQLGREIAKWVDKFAFFYDTRTGKTPMSLAIIRDDVLANPKHRWLIVCPLILIQNAWIEDLDKFFPELTYVNCHAATPAARMERLAQKANIYITNTETFAKYSKVLTKMHFEGCFVDESSTMKSPKSKVSNALVDFAQTLKRFYLLSGTPAPNGEWEYFMQMRAIDYYSMPSSYTQFKNAFFVNISRNPQYDKLVLQPLKKQELLDIVAARSLYVDKEDVLNTPGRTFIEVPLTLPNELKKHYNKLKSDLYVEVVENGKKILAPSEAAKLNKLNQVTSGFIIDTEVVKDNRIFKENNETTVILDMYRFDALYSMLNKLSGEQVIIWCNYRKEFEILKEHFGERCRCIYGGTSLDEKNQAVYDFKHGKAQYLIANPASADKGLTLTNSHIAIYFSLNWSYELFKQSMERIYGDVTIQPKECQYYVFIAEGTIDAVLYREVLQGKSQASYAILNHLKGGCVDAH